jgi:XTP/dITP diphosphohydrolase
MTMTKTIVLGFATTNPHKLRETQQCFAALDPSVTVLAVPPTEEVEETGTTFEANARLKLAACLHEGLPSEVTHVIAEDAGLIVEALEGRYGLSPFPGVYSHRWFSPTVQEALLGRTWEQVEYSDINRGLLKLMTDVENRSARYEACVACWVRETGEIFTRTGAVSLTVADEPAGENGFGYDPIMIPVGFGSSRTMAQLTAEEKNRISHRFYALSQVLAKIKS